jgi:membrane-bound lytic murein transglycosylase F
LKVKVAGKEHLLDSMQAGAADIAASDQNGTILDKTNLAYSVPLLKSDLRLIQKSAAKADNATESSVFDTTRINGKKVVIPKNAAIKKALIAYAKKHHLRFTIIQAAAHLSQEDLIQMVAQGEIDYTISDGIIAEQMSSSFKNIDCHTSIADSYQVSWVVNKQSLGLSDMFDAWVAKKGRSLEFNVILNKYTKLSKAEKKALQNQYKYAKTGSISTYDDLLRKHASAANLDWRLLAALVYQESKFNPQATSSAGAIGLMQVLPATAKWLGNNPRLLKSPEANIEAGLQYLLWLKSKWRVYISDEKELIKFTLASYNAGFGHVQDAYELAKKYKLNPLKWEGNVERMLGRKSDSSYYNDPTVRYGYCRGKEPVEYVQKIMHYYHHYQNNM